MQRYYQNNLNSVTNLSNQPGPALGSLEFSKLLLSEAEVAVAPGVGFGEHGDGFVRIGLVENVHRIRQAIRNIKAFLGRYGKVIAADERRRERILAAK